MNYLTNFPHFNSPFRELTRMQRAMDRLLEGYSPATGATKDLIQPSCELSETQSEYKLRFDLPGIPKEKIRIELNENTLSVSGERKEEKKDEKNHYSEISYGSFSRSFTFPTPVNAERVAANYDNGVLTVNVAKSEAAKTKQISVK